MPIRAHTPNISIEEMRELFNYCPDTGLLTWKAIKSGRARIGGRVGSIKRGYIIVSVGCRMTPAHRVIWALHYGEWPEETMHVDHINGDTLDNRIANLRLATTSQNRMNSKIKSTNKTGFKGVFQLRGRYVAQIKAQGKYRHLGTFDTPEEAHSKYVEAAKEHHGEFANPGTVAASKG